MDHSPRFDPSHAGAPISEAQLQEFLKTVFAATKTQRKPVAYSERNGWRYFYDAKGVECGRMSVETHEAILRRYGGTGMRRIQRAPEAPTP